MNTSPLLNPARKLAVFIASGTLSLSAALGSDALNSPAPAERLIAPATAVVTSVEAILPPDSASSPAPAVIAKPGPPVGWKLVFSDEFDGAELDTTKWSTTMEFIGTHGKRYHNEFYASYTDDEEVVLRDGQLNLRTDRRTIEGPETPNIWEYTQGLVSSHDKFFFTHGYVEIRAKYPGGRGLWPCLWLMPQDQQWPPEFDIAEYYAGQKTMHHGLAYGGLRTSRWDSTWDRATDFESDYHVYALEWTPGRAVWSIDGVPAKTITAEYVPSVPMYLILSNSVSSITGPSGEPDASTVFPNAFLIDYVRVYQPAPTVAAVLVKNDAVPLLPVIPEAPATPAAVEPLLTEASPDSAPPVP